MTNPRREGAWGWPHLATNIEAEALVLDETNIYWTSPPYQTVSRLPLSAVGADAMVPPIVLATNQMQPWGGCR